jgi:hypothetical protein|tara:strand:- start:2092 stop:2589 length:498 start_codon:yes stop_codon:yes gene_type:complete
LARKRTKGEALERLAEARSLTGRAPLKGRAKAIHDAAYLGAAGLIMLDPLNRLADEVTVVPYDMIAIPAHEYFRLSSNPTFQIYIRGGETIMPTGGNVEDVQEVVETMAVESTPVRKKRKTPYQRAYKKAFDSLAPNYKTSKGVWKKDGFKRCVRAAHKKARGGK